jgi:hypothetical protein
MTFSEQPGDQVFGCYDVVKSVLVLDVAHKKACRLRDELIVLPNSYKRNAFARAL